MTEITDDQLYKLATEILGDCEPPPTYFGFYEGFDAGFKVAREKFESEVTSSSELIALLVQNAGGEIKITHDVLDRGVGNVKLIRYTDPKTGSIILSLKQ